MELTKQQQKELVAILGKVNAAGLELREFAAELPEDHPLKKAVICVKTGRDIINQFLRNPNATEFVQAPPDDKTFDRNLPRES